MRTDPDTTSVIHRDLRQSLPSISHGEGIYLWDTEGNRYIDGSGGSAAVTAIGHAVPEVIAAIADQVGKVAYAPTHAFATEAIEECARLIAEEFAPPGLDRVWFVSGGSEATENAVKMAHQYHRDRGEPNRTIVIGRWGSFHGATISSLGYGGNTGRRRLYQRIVGNWEHIPPAFPYRCWFHENCPGCLVSAYQLEHVIRSVGPENVSAFIAEPVVGATLGAVAAPDGYFQEIRAICDRYGVLFIADEVMTGFGRCGTNFAVEQWGVTPDLIACAKGIAGGYAPLGAVIAKAEIVGEVRQRRGSFVIGHTSAGNPLSCATGTAVLRFLRDHDLVRNSADLGAYALEQLRDLQTNHPIVGDVRGRGLLLGLEFVQDRDTKAPFPPELAISRKIGAETMKRGLVSYPGNGTVDGIAGDHMLYAPPLTITRDQIDDLVGILDQSLTAVESGLAVDG